MIVDVICVDDGERYGAPVITSGVTSEFEDYGGKI
jgi:hypothetical protein